MNYLARLSELRRAHHQQTRRAEKKENTNTHNHFVTNPRGSDEVQTSWEGKKSCQPNSLPLHPTQEIRGRSEKRKKKKTPSSPCDYSLKLGIIRSQTWFTPCSSLIVLKSSVTRRRRRRRRTAASKHTYMCGREHMHTLTHTHTHTQTQ